MRIYNIKHSKEFQKLSNICLFVCQPVCLSLFRSASFYASEEIPSIIGIPTFPRLFESDAFSRVRGDVIESPLLFARISHQLLALQGRPVPPRYMCTCICHHSIISGTDCIEDPDELPGDRYQSLLRPWPSRN